MRLIEAIKRVLEDPTDTANLEQLERWSKRIEEADPYDGLGELIAAADGIRDNWKKNLTVPAQLLAESANNWRAEASHTDEATIDEDHIEGECDDNYCPVHAPYTIRDRNACELTARDWMEIYEALQYKLTSPAVVGQNEWEGHLNEIIGKIGPDGSKMVEATRR